MGIKLMVEVLDHWQDAGLTAGERSDLLVIAENANDSSRETYPKGGMHQEYILKRVGKTSAAWKNAIGKLMKKGVLTYAMRGERELSGYPGQVAMYRLAVLCQDAPHDGLNGECTRSERVTCEVTHSGSGDADLGHPSGDPSAQMGHLSDDPNPGMGHLSDVNGSPHRWEWVTSQVTPTPPTPQLPPPPPSPTQPAAQAVTPEEEDSSNSINRARLLLSRLPAPWTLGPVDAQRLAPQLAATADRLGWPIDDKLAAAICTNPGGITNPAEVLAKRRIPNLLPYATVHGTRSTLPPACRPCLDSNPHAVRNARWRTRRGQPCPTCHPDALHAAA